MKGNSIREYFNNLYNILYGILLLPLLAFVYLYLEQQAGDLGTEILTTDWLSAVLGLIVVADWAMSIIFFNAGLKQALLLKGLGERLEKYRKLTIVRYAIISSSCLILAVGFYLTHDQVLTAFFVMGMILQSSFWPTTYRLCKHLKLKGEEREMIIQKKEY